MVDRTLKTMSLNPTKKRLIIPSGDDGEEKPEYKLDSIY